MKKNDKCCVTKDFRKNYPKLYSRVMKTKKKQNQIIT